MTKFEQKVLESWRKVCQESETQTKAFLNLKWYQFFGSKYRKLESERIANHILWMSYFKVLSESGVFDRLKKKHG